MPAKTKVANKKQEFELAFQGLRKILKPYDRNLRVIKDGPGGYMSESKSIRYQGKPLMFAAIASKSYVAFHLFPVYMFPDLLKGISPELKKRMQGKTCWNFKKVEEPLFTELGGLVDASFRRFAEFGERDLSRENAQALWGGVKTKKT
ncbi:MAG: hypothetical protein ABSD76_12500 [Terriglobales bacterium]|jgi:hypothetical protein